MAVKNLLAALVAVMVVGLWVPATQATVMGIAAGDLVKIQNDHDPATHDDETVYYLDADWKRHPFPTLSVYNSWYPDFSGVKELTAGEMAQLRVGTPILYRPGTRLIKIPSIPKVYAVEPGGNLRWIETERIAIDLYGPEWSKRVDDVPEAYFVNYHEGAPLLTAAWPTGTLVRRAGEPVLYYVNGATVRRFSPLAVTQSRLVLSNAITTTSDLAEYTDAGDINDAPWNIIDASQNSFVEPLPGPQVVAVTDGATVERGSDAVIYELRASSNRPLLMKGVSVKLAGPLWTDGRANLSDLHWTDAAGNDLFGVNQLATTGASSETVAWSGAYLAPADTAVVIRLHAKIAASLTPGAVFTVVGERSSLALSDGGNNQVLKDFFPTTPLGGATVTVR